MSGRAAPLVTPVILCGGAGTRLWPLSTARTPKQFHRLGTALTLLQETALRCRGEDPVRFTAPVVLAGAAHAELVLSQLNAVGVEPAAVILEPMGRNTAAAAVLAARAVEAVAPGSLVLLLPADHRVARPEAFRSSVGIAAAHACERIVTLGVAPDHPATGYGYIRVGTPLGQGCHAIDRFAEKPDRPTAERYLAEGGWLWNAGMFLASPSLLAAEVARWRPDIAAAASAAWDKGEQAGTVRRLDPETFAACPAESLDVAVMERTDRGAVTPCDIGWADVGSWSELWRLGEGDAAGNVLAGDVRVEYGERNLVWADGDLRVSVLGVNDLVVVASGNEVLVTTRSRAQAVGRLARA